MNQNQGDPCIEDIDSKALRIVHALSITGSITAAAESLACSQPAVSQHLKKLEQRLGVSVIERVGRGVRLTQVGEVLARHARVVTAEIEAALSEIADLTGLKGGRLRLGAFPTASAVIVPELLSRLNREHPGIELSYREMEPPEAIEAVRRGELDAALTFSYPGDDVGLARAAGISPTDQVLSSGENIPGLRVEHLWREEMFVALHDAHPLAGQQEVALADLASETWIAGCPRCRGHLVSICQQSGFVPQINHETDNVVAVMSMVAASLAVALVPGLAMEALRSIPERTRLLPIADGSHRIISLVSAQSATDAPSVAAARRACRSLDSGAWNLTCVGDGALSTQNNRSKA